MVEPDPSNHFKVFPEGLASIQNYRRTCKYVRMDRFHLSCWTSLGAGGIGTQQGRQMCFFTTLAPMDIAIPTLRAEEGKQTILP